MSQLLLAKNKSLISRQSLIFITACVVNILIFYLILQMVSNEYEQINKIESINILDFIHFKEMPKIEERQIENKPQEPPKEEEKLPPPELPQPEIKKPVKTQTDLPKPNISVPLSNQGMPYIGDFLKSTEAPTKPIPATPNIATNLIPTLKTKPAYPPRALRSGIEGVVTVEFTIATDGSVKDPNIVKSDPPKIFDQSVIRTITKWKFNPTIIDGKAIEQRARQDIHFKLKK